MHDINDDEWYICWFMYFDITQILSDCWCQQRYALLWMTSSWNYKKLEKAIKLNESIDRNPCNNGTRAEAW